MSKIKAIAIHLPQFHPFAENDEWWGKGFTEWTNVTKAKPLFEGHYQPHLPADLGFYDLRLEEARMAQIALAKEYGIFGFCYYHYWFNGKRLMHEPLDRMLANEKEDFPFMLCWANENWTRRWDGQENEILIEQNYSDEDHREHAQFLCEKYFKDKRYITVDNKPVLIFYKSNLIGDIEKVIKIWKKVVIENGFPDLYLLCMDNFLDYPAEELGYDGAVHFHPDYRYLKRKKLSFLDKALNKLHISKSILYKHFVDDYSEYYSRLDTQKNLKSAHIYPGITPMWDNTARKKTDGIILKGSTPTAYGKILAKLLANFKPKSNQETFFFINAWNEWAEGNHLEPCQKWGLQYLDETKKALMEVKSKEAK